jgi:UDP-glucose 4-epimerase
VFHLAALPGVRTSWGDAFHEYTGHNIEATARLLEVCRHEGAPRFVYASSSSVYGDAERFPAKETDPTSPISPYGVTKLAGEHLARLYARNFGLFSVSLRFFTVYGPRQRPDMAFHRFIRGVLTGQPNPVFGDGEQTRDFTFVSDAVQSCLGALRAPRPGSVYNVGGGSRVTVKEVIAIIEAQAGRKGRWTFTAPEAGDPRHTAADTTSARAEIGYNPRVGLEEGLRRQVEWMTQRLEAERGAP